MGDQLSSGSAPQRPGNVGLDERRRRQHHGPSESQRRGGRRLAGEDGRALGARRRPAPERQARAEPARELEGEGAGHLHNQKNLSHR
eukprot:8643582-Pyramimonas_sp.AAC.1